MHPHSQFYIFNYSNDSNYSHLLSTSAPPHLPNVPPPSKILSNGSAQQASHLNTQETTSSISSSISSGSKSRKSSRSSSSKLVKTTVLTFVNDKKQPTMNSIDERYIFIGSDINSSESTQSSLSSSTSSSSSLSYLSPFNCSNQTKNETPPNNNEDTLSTLLIPSIDSKNSPRAANHTIEEESCNCNCNCITNQINNETNFNITRKNTEDLDHSDASLNNSKNVPKPQPRSIYLNYDERPENHQYKQNLDQVNC